MAASVRRPSRVKVWMPFQERKEKSQRRCWKESNLQNDVLCEYCEALSDSLC